MRGALLLRRTGVVALAAAWLLIPIVVLRPLGVNELPGPLGWLSYWSYNLVQIAAVASCLARAVCVPRSRAAWLLLSLGMTSYAAADMYWALVLADLEVVPYPSIGDALYLGFYPCALIALLLLAREQVGRFSAAVWLDGLVGAFGVAAIGGALVFPVVLAQTGGPASTVLTNLAYPLGDALLLALVVGVVGLSGWRPNRSWLLIAGGLALFATVDTIYLYQTANGTYLEGTLVDVGWPAAFAVMALAAWQPVAKARSRVGGWPLLAIPATVGASSLAVLLYDHFDRIHTAALVLATAAVAAVIVRLGVTFAEHLDMLATSRHEAMTDVLTGLDNRRALMRDMERDMVDCEGLVLLALFDLDGFKPYNDTFGHPAGDALLARLGERLRSAVAPATAYRMGGDEFCVLAVIDDAPEAARILDAAAQALRERGDMFEVTASHGMVLVPEDATDPVEALRLADQRMYEHKARGRTSGARQSIEALVRAVRARDGELGAHGADVATTATAVAAAMGMSQREQEHVTQAAELHDVGKLAIPDEILHKPGPLDAHEWSFMRRHAEIGQRIVGESATLTPVGTLIRSSHERWDGSGYPDGLRGETIPLGARIIAVCDAYDAMTHTRTYARARTHADAIAELRACAGGHFDPAVVECFCAVVSTLPVA